MKANTIAFALCASAFLAAPALAQMTTDMGTVKTLSQTDKLTITENWLKPAPTALRPAVGKCLNELRAYVEQQLEDHRTDEPFRRVFSLA